jgi:transposase-like protein
MSEFDIDNYATNDHGLLTQDGILQALEDNPAFSRFPTVLDSARYLYRDNDTRWKFQELYNAGKGDDDPDVSDIQEWKRVVEGHDLDDEKYGINTDDGDASEPEDHEPSEVAQPDEEVTWADVRETILRYFDQDTLDVCEALATVPIQLMFDDFTDCPMVIVVGNASSGKTTALELFKGWDRIFTTHEVTPAAFVSHNADQDDDDLGEMDLLPKITGEVLWVPEMGTWFSGDDIEEYMRTLSGVADGSGYVKSTGAQGSHGYDGDPGDYQFGLMGATTPPSPRAWSEMGNAGARVLMHGMPNTDDDDEVRDQIYGDSGVSYAEKKRIVQEKISNWLRTLYHEHDGHIEMEPEDPDGDVAAATVKLAEIIAKGRGVSYAKENEEGDLEGDVQIEDRKRVIQMLRFTARARAAMDGRTKVTTDDLQVCARIAFATMPEKRREMVRLLCNPRNGTSWTTSEVKRALGLGSKHTAKKRMQTVSHLGLAEYESEGETTRGGTTDVVRLVDEELMWLFSADSESGDHAGPLSWPFE